MPPNTSQHIVLFNNLRQQRLRTRNIDDLAAVNQLPPAQRVACCSGHRPGQQGTRPFAFDVERERCIPACLCVSARRQAHSAGFDPLGSNHHREQSCASALTPALWNPEFPPCDQARGLKCRIELGMAGGEPVPAGLYQRRTLRVAFGKKAKALKDSAVAKTRSIAEKRVNVAVTVDEINRQAIGYVLDSTASF